MSNLLTESLSSNYSCFYVPAIPDSPDSFGFWCDDANNEGKLDNARKWVREWELFTIIEDPTHKGIHLIRSNRTGLFMTVDPVSNRLKCTETRAVVEARFKVSFVPGMGHCIYSPQYNKYINVETTGKRELVLDSSLPVYFEKFSVRKIALGDEKFSIYGVPKNGYISMTSKTPYTFYMIQSELEEDIVYLETSNFEFIYPTNTSDPITYAETPLKKDAYKFEMKPYEGSDLLQTFKSVSLGRYLSHDALKSDDVILCNEESPDSGLCAFGIKSM